VYLVDQHIITTHLTKSHTCKLQAEVEILIFYSMINTKF